MITLYPDQQSCVDSVRSAMRRSRRVLLVSPTGSGKTVMFSYIASRTAERGKRITIIVHRDELVGQVSNTLTAFSVPHGIIAGGYPETPGPVQVASVFSLPTRLHRLPVPDLLISDEAHHCTEGSTWGKVIGAWQKTLLLGVTASPTRLDGQGLGNTFGVMVQGKTVAELIAMGRLSRYRIFAPARPHIDSLPKSEQALAIMMDKPSITGDAVAHYRRHLDGRPAVAFCVSIAHAQHVAEQFRADGYSAAAVDGTMDRQQRRRIMADFGAVRLNVLTSCDLISEGYDCPGMFGAILLRPTTSLGLYLQQVGRALRVHPGKDEAVFLDHAGNCMRHGMPDDDREWSLTGDAVVHREADPDEIAIKQCPKCFMYVRSVIMTCPTCGHIWTPKPREVRQVAGELAEVDLSAQRTQARIEQGRAKDIESLMKLGHSESRARIIIAARAEKDELRRQVMERTRLPRGQVWQMKPKQLRELLSASGGSAHN